MFKFNFMEGGTEEIPDPIAVKNAQNIELKECREINFLDDDIPRFKYETVRIKDEILKFRKPEVDFDQSDLIPNVYEGGFKIWECTMDLLAYLSQVETDFKGKTVLDLGCGCGLLGIYAALCGAKTVHFQDYNENVLKTSTIPNVKENRVDSEVKFFAGDWSSFKDTRNACEYDIVLTSETIYNSGNYAKLRDIFVKKLKKNGRVYLAAKSYYFGIGGNTRDFNEFLLKTGLFNVEEKWKCLKGVDRKIICIENT